MKIQLKNKDFNGEYITYVQVCEIAWACIREKEMGVN